MTEDVSNRSRALVTGASRGLGRELAVQLAERGHPLVLVARSEEDLEALADDLRDRVEVRVLPADLSEPGERDRLVETLERKGLEVGVLVNNAGFGTFGPFWEGDRATELDQIRVNVEALTDLTRRFLPSMLDAGKGRILNVASTAAFQPGPLMAVYYATKSYVLSFSEALAEELSGTEVTVTCLCPGPTRTEFHARAEMEDSRLLTLGRMAARPVARRGLNGLMRGRRVVVPGFANWLGTVLVRFLPRRLTAKVVRILQERVD